MEAGLERQVEEARKVIRAGGIAIYPTETAYGIGADALDPEAVEKVYEMKQRPREKGLTVIVNDMKMAEKYGALTDLERELVRELMPGPLTLVSEKKDNIPDVLNEKFVFRVSSSEIASALAEDGPLTATSANVSGAETSYSVKDIDRRVLEKADYVIDAGKIPSSPTSTIAEVNNSGIVIHRKGPVTRERLEEVLKNVSRT